MVDQAIQMLQTRKKGNESKTGKGAAAKFES